MVIAKSIKKYMNCIIKEYIADHSIGYNQFLSFGA